ncbi:MAG: TetR/AcrR family transcriptional regulator [Desulfobacteraceae bacterium]|nr:TetR/AcrR family transcriptional regulator [Desulfobacteraceae bacterium]
MGTPKDSELTRARIIDAAGQLFAEQGRKGVTVRDIARKADTHLSALNYHFRTKESLYREVLLSACESDSISENDQETLRKLPARTALKILVKKALAEYAKQTANNWRTVIINRETWDPSPVFEEVVEAYFKPNAEFMAGIIGNIVDKPPDDQEVRFAVIGLIGLLETYGLYGHLIDGVFPGLVDRFAQKEWLADRIVHLTLAAAESGL